MEFEQNDQEKEYWINFSLGLWRVTYYKKERGRLRRCKYKTDDPDKMAEWLRLRMKGEITNAFTLHMKKQYKGMQRSVCSYCDKATEVYVFKDKKLCPECIKFKRHSTYLKETGGEQ